jgi:hypothetical protein
LPDTGVELAAFLLYVFDGEVAVDNGITLKSGESLFIEGEKPSITPVATSDVVLFVTNKRSTYSETGMYSGNQIRK